MNFSALWQEHRKFIIGVGGSALAVAVVFLLFIQPASKKADTLADRAKKNERKLTNLFAGPPAEHPTQALKREYQKMQGALKTREEELLKDVCFPVEPPFILPQGEKQPTVYFGDVQDRVRATVRNQADLNAIELKDENLGFDRQPNKDDCAKALALLAMVRTAALTAVEAQVASIVKFTFKGEQERSMQVHDRRIEEVVISVEVRGLPDAILRWMKLLQRRGSFLQVVACDISRIKDSELVRCNARLGAISVRRVEKAGDEEDEEEEEPRRW